jgi:hypothetical protein
LECHFYLEVTIIVSVKTGADDDRNLFSSLWRQKIRDNDPFLIRMTKFENSRLISQGKFFRDLPLGLLLYKQRNQYFIT